MNRIQILDCTLRDGGYCNEWRFGFENIKRITEGLVEANVEIIECGFLTNKVVYDPSITRFTTIEEIAKVIPLKRDNKLFVAMMNYGEYRIDDLPCFDGSSIDGIRVAFHKKNRYEALELCKKIKAKGYLVFIQAMVSLSYSDQEFLEMIKTVNEFEPYAFYIVDSFGMMKGKDLTRLFFMVEHNLKDKIWIGFHSHNNMQLAYANAQRLTTVQTNRNLIIDSSIMGMGRGAGNLNTELFVEYLNENAAKEYEINPLLTIIDDILNVFYQECYWGYSLPNYISASHNAHPNYAGYLDDKKTLTIEDMNEIFDMMEEDKKVSFDREYIESLYLRYMERGDALAKHQSELEGRIKGKKILLIAPGKSSFVEKEKVIEFAKKTECVVISINHFFEFATPDFIFVSNLRRFRELDSKYKEICIATSNIKSNDLYFQVDYRKLLNDEDTVRDNAGLMAIKFFLNQDIAGIYLAGFDGYSHDVNSNYGNTGLTIIQRNEVYDSVNYGMQRVLLDYAQKTKIVFITQPKYVKI